MNYWPSKLWILFKIWTQIFNLFSKQIMSINKKNFSIWWKSNSWIECWLNMMKSTVTFSRWWINWMKSKKVIILWNFSNSKMILPKNYLIMIFVSCSKRPELFWPIMIYKSSRNFSVLIKQKNWTLLNFNKNLSFILIIYFRLP